MRFRPGWHGLVLPVILLLVVTGCTAAAGGDSTEAEPGAEDTGAAAQVAMDAFTECMREHGVPMDDIDVQSGRMGLAFGQHTDPAAVESAMRACGELRDQAIEHLGVGHELDPEEQRRLEAQVMAFAQCMRDQGIDWPDPQVGSGGMRMGGAGAGGPGGPDMSDPAVRSAMDACLEGSDIQIRTRPQQ